MISASYGVVDGYRHPSGKWIEGYIYCKTCGCHLELYGDPALGWIGRCQDRLIYNYYDDTHIPCPGNKWHYGIGEIAFPVPDSWHGALR